MEATAVVKKIVTELFEHKKFVDGHLAEKQQELHLFGESGTLDEDIDALEDIVNSYEDLITQMKDAFNIEDLEIEEGE
jgi:archaellum component FlaC